MKEFLWILYRLVYAMFDWFQAQVFAVRGCRPSIIRFFYVEYIEIVKPLPDFRGSSTVSLKHARIKTGSIWFRNHYSEVIVLWVPTSQKELSKIISNRPFHQVIPDYTVSWFNDSILVFDYCSEDAEGRR